MRSSVFRRLLAASAMSAALVVVVVLAARGDRDGAAFVAVLGLLVVSYWARRRARHRLVYTHLDQGGVRRHREPVAPPPPPSTPGHPDHTRTPLTAADRPRAAAGHDVWTSQTGGSHDDHRVDPAAPRQLA